MHYLPLSVRIAIVILLLTKAISAQVVTIPYNPDVDSDSLIGSNDLLSFLPIYGGPFTPNAVLIDSLQWDIYLEQNASADTSFPQGSQLGEMQYFTGDQWVILAPGPPGSTLTMHNNVPTWVINPLEFYFGCMDSLACNYQPLAFQDFMQSCLTVDSIGVCGGDCFEDLNENDICDSEEIPDVLGCTDASSCNFLPAANIDDGSCLYEGQACDDGSACTYDDVINGCSCSGQFLNCDDGIPCTFDACIESAGGCESTPNDALCDDLDPSNGVETCDVTLGCQPGTPLVVWNQLGADIDGEAEGDLSGSSVSLSADGTIVAIGAFGNGGNGGGSGHVRLYQWNGSAWNQLGEDIDGEAAGDWSGWSVSLSSDGSIVAIGARANDGNGDYSGHMRLYQWSGAAWNQLGEDIDGEAAGDYSGHSVSLSADGTVVAIGASGNDGNGENSGHVRLYQWNGTAWNQLGGDIDGEAEADNSGRSVSLSSDGTIVAIGAPYNNGNGASSGHVGLYQWNGAAWNQLGADIDGEAVWNTSGWSVSLSSDGSIVAIGARANDGNGASSGHVRLYQWNGAAWNQLGADIDGEAGGDSSGSSVSLSADGSVVAIGALSNDGNGSKSGHVRLYQWNGAVWNQLGDDFDGEAAGDKSGSSVSLSSDGTIVAIGAPYNNGNGTASGHVRVYSFE